jgi:hypothetical protein
MIFALLPFIVNRRELQNLWKNLNSESICIAVIATTTVFVAQATFTWTFSRIPFLFWNHYQNSRRLHAAVVQFAAQVSCERNLQPAQLLCQFSLWSKRHAELLDARRALDSSMNGPFGVLLCAVAGLAATLVVQLFLDKLGIDNLQAG